MSNIQDMRSYYPNNNEQNKFFFDTNIWMAIYGPVGYSHRFAYYCSQLFEKLKRNKCIIYTNNIVLSEFVNASARMVFNQNNQKRKEDGQESLEFKDFRSTNDFKDIAEETSYFVKKIMSDSHKLNCNIDETNVFHTIVPKYETGKYDFNDLFIEETCKNHNLILVTNDRDLQKSGIPILTANSAMLKGNR